MLQKKKSFNYIKKFVTIIFILNPFIIFEYSKLKIFKLKKTKVIKMKKIYS